MVGAEAMGLPVSVIRTQARGQAERETTGHGGDCGGPERRHPSEERTSPSCWICQGPTVPRYPSFSREAKTILTLMKTVGQTACRRTHHSQGPLPSPQRRFSMFSCPIPHVRHSSLHRRSSLVPMLAPGRESRLKCSCTPRPPNPGSTRRSHLCLP